jgi:hypothetical protein
VAVLSAGSRDRAAGIAAVRLFREALAELERPAAPAADELDLTCERPPARPRSRR